MKLYPPSNYWSAEIKNPSAFRDFVMRWDVGGHSGFEGKVKLDASFQVERILRSQNIARPQIHGRIEETETGQENLIIHLESPKRMWLVLFLMPSIVLILSITQLNWISLIAFPILLLIIYLSGYFFHSLERKRTVIAVQELLKFAQEIE